MKISTADPRVIRTQELLRAALMNLVTEKSYHSLTIQDITRRAGLNRTTFYLHYSGLHELLEDCTRSLFGQMRTEIYANQPLSDPLDRTKIEPYVESVFRHLEKYRNFYQAMLGRQGDPYFQVLFQNMLSELIFEPIGQSTGENLGERFEMVQRFYSAGFTGIASWWLDNGMPVSVEQASRQVIRDILPGYFRLMEKS